MKELYYLYASFFRIGLFTFGGGYAMLPMLKFEVVDKHKWIDEEEMLNIYAIGQCTPGIIAINTATYIGYQRAGVLGAISATMGEITPSLIIIILIASVLQQFMDVPLVLHAFAGIRITVCALLLHTVIEMTKKNVRNLFSVSLFALTLILSFFISISTIFLIIIAATAGLLMERFGGKN